MQFINLTQGYFLPAVSTLFVPIFSFLFPFLVMQTESDPAGAKLHGWVISSAVPEV